MLSQTAPLTVEAARQLREVPATDALTFRADFLSVDADGIIMFLDDDGRAMEVVRIGDEFVKTEM